MTELEQAQALIDQRIEATWEWCKRADPGISKAKAAQWFRLNTLYWIEDEHGRKVKFRATPIQTAWFFGLHTKNVGPKARQVRLSTICGLMALDTALLGTNQTCGIVDKTDEDAKRKLARIRFAYQHLDDPDDPVAAVLGKILKITCPLTADNAHEMVFANESKIWASTSLRGGTITFLWITEFGPISADFPDKAAEIHAGALNAVHAGTTAIIESTHKGGRFGKFYDMIRLAQKSPRKPNPMQWKLHFFGWQDEPSYKLPLYMPLILTAKQVDYFEALEKAWGRKLTNEQKHWYVMKSAEQGDAMAMEFPGTLEEALRGRVEGSIYGDLITQLRAKGRVCDLVVDREAPLLTFWDIGMSDLTCVWLVQWVGFDIHAIDYHTGSGMTPAQHVAALMEWERAYKRPIFRHFLPHDANNRGQSGDTYLDLLGRAGLMNAVVVPRTPDVWVGINALRALLPRFFFSSACEREWEIDGVMQPSGLASLEGYRRKVEAVGGKISEVPVHDQCSHGSSALRTLAEAHSRRMLVNIPAIAGEQRRERRAGQAIGGLSDPDVRMSDQAGKRKAVGYVA